MMHIYKQKIKLHIIQRQHISDKHSIEKYFIHSYYLNIFNYL